MLDPFAVQTGRYFLTPVNLVPNGRAHLGHIAGPLLRMDMLARHLRRQGAHVALISSSDVHESHVLVKAFQEGRSPAAVANDYHDRIDRDLKALDIAYDAFLNPLDPAWAPTYGRVNRDLVSALVGAGATRIVRERLPRRRDRSRSPRGHDGGDLEGDFVLGGWLAGRCPSCGTGGVSFFCERCGAHFRPEQMRDPRPRIGDSDAVEDELEWIEVDTLFLDLPKPERLTAAFDAMALRPDFRAIAERYMAREGAAIRLTHPGRWGVAWDVAQSTGAPPIPQVVFTYSGVLFGCHLMCGEAYGRLTGSGRNAFDAGETVTTVISFGIDNAVPFIVGVLGCGLGQTRFRPVDRYLTNHFYTLEGAKFSTNRGHVVWGGDIATLTPAGSDQIRAYLATANPEFAIANFDVEGFVAFNNRLVAGLAAALDSDLEPMAPGAPDPTLVHALANALTAQASAFGLDAFCLADAVPPILTWLDRRPAYAVTPAQTYWWRKALGLLAWPVMPKVGQALWRASGHDDQPNAAVFFEPREPRALDRPAAARLTAPDLAPCLPATLARRELAAD